MKKIFLASSIGSEAGEVGFWIVAPVSEYKNRNRQILSQHLCMQSRDLLYKTVHRRIMLIVVMVCFFLGNGAYGQPIIPENWKRESALPERIVSQQKLFKGKKGIRFELNVDDSAVNNGKRSEISTPVEESPDVERWYSFSILLPADFAKDSIPEIVAQWHSIPDFSLGEAWRSPPIALMIKNGHWWLDVRWATAPVNTNKTVSGQQIVDLGAYTKNRWTNWVFHIKFSYQNKGVIEVVKNGHRVFTRHGGNFYNDQKGPYFKFGIYKWGWKNKQAKLSIRNRVVYFSSVIIGDKQP